MKRRRWLQAALAAAVTATGCAPGADSDHRGDDAPSAGELPTRPRTAWVFSSGGPRGFVHVGVLKGLAELGLAPDVVLGASVGALIGVLYAGGRSAADIEALALAMQPWQSVGVTLGGERWLSNGPLAGFVREQALAERLEQLPLPAVCVAQRLGGDIVGLNRGDLGLAVRAACAIEGRFNPVRIRGERLVDADLHMPLPVRLARQLGATRVLAVDASAHEDRAPEGAQRYRDGDLHKRALTRPDAELADVLLHPDFGYWVSLSQEFRLRAIEAGYRAVLAAEAPLRALHAA